MEYLAEKGREQYKQIKIGKLSIIYVESLKFQNLHHQENF